MGSLSAGKIERGRKLALDTVCFVYFLEHHPRHYPTARSLFRRIESGELTAVMSSLVFSELLVPPYRSNDDLRAETVIRLLTSFPNLQVLPLTSTIAASAAKVRAIHHMRTPDAIHAATALEAGTDGIVTNDKGFLRLSTRTRIWTFSPL